MPWTDEQLTLRRTVRAFVEAEIAPLREELEHGALPPYEVLRKYVRAFGIDDLERERFYRPKGATTAAERYERAVFKLLPMIEFCRYSPGLTTAMGVSMNLAGATIDKGGTPEQRERWALPLLTMETIGAWAITEPNSGSDAFGGMQARAVRDGEGFVLQGTKTFITNSPHADTLVFICKLDDGSDARKRQVLSFILDRGMNGLEFSKPLRKMGLHSCPTGEVFVSEVSVGVDRLLGGAVKPRDSAPQGDRASARDTFASERASIAAMALGMIERCLEASLEFAESRVQFGKSINQFQLIQAKLAWMEVARINVENLLVRYLDAIKAGKRITLAEASAMKLYSARAAVEVAFEAVQLFGGSGYMAEYHVEQLARDAKVLQIYGGTDELQILSIARELIGSRRADT